MNKQINKQKSESDAERRETKVYHHESVVNFSTVHTILSIYDDKLVFDSFSVISGKTMKTPKTHVKKLKEMIK